MKRCSVFLSLLVSIIITINPCYGTTATRIAVPIQDKLFNDSDYAGPLPKRYWIAREACRCDSSSWRLWPNFMYQDCETWLRTAPDFILIPDHLCDNCGMRPSLRPELYCDMRKDQPHNIDTSSCKVVIYNWSSIILFTTLATWVTTDLYVAIFTYLLRKRRNSSLLIQRLWRHRYNIWRVTAFVSLGHLSACFIAGMQEVPCDEASSSNCNTTALLSVFLITITSGLQFISILLCTAFPQNVRR